MNLVIAMFDVMNSRTFKDLCNEIYGLSSTCPLFKYFQGLEFRRKKFKYFQGLSRMCGNPADSDVSFFTRIRMQR